MNQNNSMFVIMETSPHRATAGDDGMTIVETQTGECREDDIVRLMDDYGRVGTITQAFLFVKIKTMYQ